MKYYKMDCGCSFPVVQEREGQLPLMDFDVREARYDCPIVWSMLGKGLTKGVFQLESHLGRQWCKRLKPEKLEHLAALGALLRPGALNCMSQDGDKESKDGKPVMINATEKYCRCKNGESPVTLVHPSIDDILKPTYGIWAYQEQIMEIAKRVAGFDLVGVDELRKAVGVKDQAKLAKVGEKFAAGIAKVGIISKELGEKLWEDIKTSGRYLFNLAHSHAYGVNGFWSAYLKAHFPLYFFTAYLKHAYEEQEPFEEIRELINEAKLFNLEVRPPSITNFKKHFDTDGEKIYFGIVDIKGVGDSHHAKMVNHFTDAEGIMVDTAINHVEVTIGKPLGKPTCWFGFLAQYSSTIGISTCEKLIKAGAIDAISTISRNQMLDELNKFSLLSPTEKEWICDHHSEYATFLDLMVGLARPKKEGGGCHNKNRLAMCLDIIKLLREPSNSLVDDPNWIAWNERLLLGESITCSKIDGCDTTQANCTCKEFLAGRGKSGKYRGMLVLAVSIIESHIMTIKKGDKKGEQFARLIVQDNSAQLSDVLVWPEKYSEYSDLLFQDNVVCLIGSRNKKDGFEVESVTQL